MTKAELAALHAESRAITEAVTRLTADLEAARKRGDWQRVHELVEQLAPLNERSGAHMMRLADAVVAPPLPKPRKAPARR